MVVSENGTCKSMFSSMTAILRSHCTGGLRGNGTPILTPHGSKIVIGS